MFVHFILYLYVSSSEYKITVSKRATLFLYNTLIHESVVRVTLNKDLYLAQGNVDEFLHLERQ